MNLSYKVYDAMTTSPVVISKEATIQEAAALMAENKVASLVIKEGEKFLGLLTERDITRKVAAKNLDSSKTLVKHAMSTKVLTIAPTDEIRDAVKKIAKAGQKQLPVVEKDVLVGLLTFKDIMRVQPQLFGLIYETYNIREEERKPVYITKENEGVCSVCGDYSYSLTQTDDSEELCPHCNSVL
jgi:CBS domain-containing protein